MKYTTNFTIPKLKNIINNPSAEDITNGYYYRYFAKMRNTNDKNLYEIDEKAFSAISYRNDFVYIFKIKWFLRENIKHENPVKINKRIVDSLPKYYSKLVNLKCKPYFDEHKSFLEETTDVRNN